MLQSANKRQLSQLCPGADIANKDQQAPLGISSAKNEGLDAPAASPSLNHEQQQSSVALPGISLETRAGEHRKWKKDEYNSANSLSSKHQKDEDQVDGVALNTRQSNHNRRSTKKAAEVR